MQTNNGDNGIPLSSFDEMDKNGATKVKVGRDSDSEEAILFERTVQVTYEDRQDSGPPVRNSAIGYADPRSHQPKVWTGNRSMHTR